VKAILDAIPYLQLHDLELLEAGRGMARLGLRLRREMTNHVGILHAGALYTLAETTAGVAVQGAVPEAMILLRDAAVRYLKAGRSDVIASASTEPAASMRARERFVADGRADLEAGVVVETGTGECLMEGTFRYALRPGG